jgi:hypothetical protein
VKVWQSRGAAVEAGGNVPGLGVPRGREPTV